MHIFTNKKREAEDKDQKRKKIDKRRLTLDRKADFGLQTLDKRKNIANCKLQIVKCKMKIEKDKLSFRLKLRSVALEESSNFHFKNNFPVAAGFNLRCFIVFFLFCLRIGK